MEGKNERKNSIQKIVSPLYITSVKTGTNVSVFLLLFIKNDKI